MLKAAICDDDKKFTDIIEYYVTKHYADCLEYTIHYSAEELIAFEEAEQKSHDIYILDIEMGEMNGLELAQKLRDKDEGIAIVFMSNHNYMPDSFYVRPHHYLMKPVTDYEDGKMAFLGG